VIDRQLRGLGVASLQQLADLWAADMQRADLAIDFPSR
jgi:predicted flap endonuclease-1-like 5' DNA nuclease